MTWLGQVNACKKKRKNEKKRSDVLIICFLFSFQLFSHCIQRIPCSLAWTPLLLRPTISSTRVSVRACVRVCGIWYGSPRVRRSFIIHTTARALDGDCANVLIRFRDLLSFSLECRVDAMYNGMCVLGAFCHEDKSSRTWSVLLIFPSQSNFHICHYKL